MYIHDVIGQLRGELLELRRKIDELRLSVHMLEWELHGRPQRTDVSRETKEGEGNASSSQPTLF